jgi:hypothetical protein
VYQAYFKKTFILEKKMADNSVDAVSGASGSASLMAALQGITTTAELDKAIAEQTKIQNELINRIGKKAAEFAKKSSDKPGASTEPTEGRANKPPEAAPQTPPASKPEEAGKPQDASAGGTAKPGEGAPAQPEAGAGTTPVNSEQGNEGPAGSSPASQGQGGANAGPSEGSHASPPQSASPAHHCSGG